MWNKFISILNSPIKQIENKTLTKGGVMILTPFLIPNETVKNKNKAKYKKGVKNKISFLSSVIFFVISAVGLIEPFIFSP